jgi:hypothetical protein
LSPVKFVVEVHNTAEKVNTKFCESCTVEQIWSGSGRVYTRFPSLLLKTRYSTYPQKGVNQDLRPLRNVFLCFPREVYDH